MNTNNPYQATAGEQEPQRKNRLLVIALVFFVALAVLFGVASIWMARRARQAENMARQARQAAVQAQEQALRAQQELTPVE